MGKKRTQTIEEIKSEGQLCTACNKKKDVSEFYPSYQYTGGRKCKPCVKEYSRKHHKKSYENLFKPPLYFLPFVFHKGK